MVAYKMIPYIMKAAAITLVKQIVLGMLLCIQCNVLLSSPGCPLGLLGGLPWRFSTGLLEATDPSPEV